MVGACLSCITLPSLALAVSSPQVRNGDNCQTLNKVIDNGLFEFKCVKKGSQKIYRRIGPLKPKGNLYIYETGGKYGQSHAEDKCSNWRLKVRNDSNVLIESMYFNPVKGKYWFHPAYLRMPDIPADAIGLRIILDLPPYIEREIEFQTCTTRPNPGQGYEFFSDSPRHVSWNWANKLSGILCFNC